MEQAQKEKGQILEGVKAPVRRVIKLGQEENDLKQVRDCIKTLSNVYKSQVNDAIMDNGNISIINNAILNCKNIERWLIAHPPEEVS